MSPQAADTRNIVAIFHASFHPTQGNIVDWSLKASDDVSLDGVEFSVLPSGLHLVERDTLYFTHQDRTGLALFRRRPTLSHGHRGFRLSSVGILLASSARPRPWAHLAALHALAEAVYASAESRACARVEGRAGAGGELTDKDWELARAWFEERKHRPATAAEADLWTGWSDELDGVHASLNAPTPHLPHLLRILGLSSLTLYKFVLSRRRVLIFTLPPVEVSCILAWIAADLCREHHMSSGASSGVLIEGLHGASGPRRSAACREGLRVLGMVTLSDLDRLQKESQKGQGWIACTTDAIFLEKPSYYDLIIDLSTSTPSKSSRPTLYMSKPVSLPPNSKKRPSWKLETVRFTWSDIKLWTELDRILKLDATTNAHTHAHARSASTPPERVALPQSSSASAASPKWGDAFQLYDDVCLLCASLWMGVGTWRSNSRASFATAGKDGDAAQWGAVRLEGDDDWSLGGTHMRNLGMGIEGRGDVADGARIRALGLGIEGRPSGSAAGAAAAVPRATRRWSLSSASKTVEEDAEGETEEGECRRRTVRTTLALLQTFHAHTAFLASQLRGILPPRSALSTPTALSRVSSPRDAGSADEDDVVAISAKALLALELGALSELDAKFVEWLAEAEGYAGAGVGRRVVVKRGWRDLLSVVLGFG